MHPIGSGLTAAKLSALLLLFFGCGCATQAQKQYQATVTNDKAALERLSSCAVTVYSSTEAIPVRAHAPLKSTDATLQQLSDESRATDKEISALLTIHPRFQECRKNFLSDLSQSSPTLVPIFAESYNRNEDNLLELLQRKIAWGEYLRRSRDIGTETQAAVQVEIQRIVAGLEQDHRAELVARQRAAAAMAQSAQTQQLINAMNRPIPQNPAVNCVGQRIGDFTYTNCR
jgi:hypothetical protein